MLEDIDKWDGVVVKRTDRFSRDTESGWHEAKNLAACDKFLYLIENTILINKKNINSSTVEAIFSVNLMVGSMERKISF